MQTHTKNLSFTTPMHKGAQKNGLLQIKLKELRKKLKRILSIPRSPKKSKK